MKQKTFTIGAKEDVGITTTYEDKEFKPGSNNTISFKQ
jgi:hypothetical protein